MELEWYEAIINGVTSCHNLSSEELHCIDSFILDYKILSDKFKELEESSLKYSVGNEKRDYKKFPNIADLLNMECNLEEVLLILNKVFDPKGEIGKMELVQNWIGLYQDLLYRYSTFQKENNIRGFH